MVRRRTARGLKLFEVTVWVNVSGLWRIGLRALDDDPRVSVLINLSVTRDALSTPGFPTRRWTVLWSPSRLSRPWWNLFQSFVVVAVEKWKSVLCFPSAAFFPRPSGCHRLQRLMPIVFAAGQ